MRMTGHRWRTVQAQVFAEETHCCLCGRWVDQTLTHWNANEARSVHHIVSPDVAPWLAYERTNLRLAHRICNVAAGQGGDPVQIQPSRAWL